MDEEELEDEFEVRDSNGNLISNGDTVLIVKDLKVKGGRSIEAWDQD